MITRTATLYKTSFTGLSSETWLLSFIMLINRSGTMVVPFMTLYLTGKGMGRSLAEAGTVMGLFGLGAITGAYFGGRFTDRIGFFRVQMLALVLGGVLFMLLGQLKSYPLICLFTFLLSLFNESFRPANSAAVAYFSKPENTTRSYSLNRLAINLGWAVGTSLGGLIASYNYELLFWVDGFTNIMAAALLFIFLRPSRLELKPVRKEEASVMQSAYRDKSYLYFILLTMIFGLCFFQMFTTVPKYLRDGLSLSENYIGFVMAINGLLIALIEMVLVYILERRGRIVLFISLGASICALAFFSLLLPGNGKLISLLMILLITIGEIVAMPFMNTYWISRSSEQNRGQYAALYTIAWGVGQTLGPFLCSLLAEAAGFHILFIVLGIALTLSALGYSQLKYVSKN